MANYLTLQILFHNTREHILLILTEDHEKKGLIFQTLSNMKDFYMEMKWNFESSFIPFFSKFAPSDTYKIWKVGSSMRLDFSFLGVNKKHKFIKTNTSILFRNFEQVFEENYPGKDKVILQKDKKFVIDPFAQIEEKDKKEFYHEMINDMLKSTP